MTAYLLVNFGGPRSLDEIEPFLKELLTDRDVIRTRFPKPLHNWLFSRVAKKRALKIAHDYVAIGGKSPIFADTEAIAKGLGARLNAPVLTFHRYLPATHAASLSAIDACTATTLRALPLFPQFCFATTGSIARKFEQTLSLKTVSKLRWIHSYAEHPAFIEAHVRHLENFCQVNKLREEETAFVFSAHGVPRQFIADGDPYQSECERTFERLRARFPKAICRLCYQSKFGPGEWLGPATDATCKNALSWISNRRSAVIVPLTFTTDHIETLFEIETLYLPLLRANGLSAYRCPALNLEPYWLDALAEIADTSALSTTQMLVRR